MSYFLPAFAIVILASLAWYFLRKPRETPAVVASTYDGPIDQYCGGKTLLVAVHASWASVWLATAEALSKADLARYDIKLIEANQDPELVHSLGVQIVPTVIVYRDGCEVSRLPNMVSLDQLP